MPVKIQKLDETVVNRIAAGEVIQRPANALKELLENSIDAGATSIQVTVKDGGLKLLQIQDNGSGIEKDDLEIVCERFTTSKLRKFEDLSNIATFGFRGEALASISHVAHLTIVTKTADRQCAYKCQYVDGKPKASPKPCAGTQGTQIIVEDLFYNVATRRNALKSASEEYARINEVVSRYAVHYSQIGFLLKKAGDPGADVRTAPKSTSVDNIRTIFGSAVARSLTEIRLEDDNYKFKAHGWVTNGEYSGTKFIMLLFINGRLVESAALKKAFDVVYGSYLGKGKRPFVYLGLDLAPCNVDVNVHPTKHEVHFLHEDVIIEKIQQNLDAVLRESCGVRTFVSQTNLPAVKPVFQATLNSSQATVSTSSGALSASAVVAPPPRIYEHSMVRVDSREQTMDKFLTPRPPAPPAANVQRETPLVEQHQEALEQRSEASDTSGTRENLAYQRRTFNLTSLQTLRAAVTRSAHREIREVLRNSSFVGCVTPSQMLIQHETKLWTVNYRTLSEEYFYQVMLNDFGNYGVIKFSSPLALYELVELALDCEESGWTEADGPKATIATYAKDLLVSKREMLQDYFSVVIDRSGNLCGIPLLLRDYVPDTSKLPLYVLRLATDTEWNKEKECFQTICKITAAFYSQAKQTEKDTQHSWSWTIRNVVYPALKANLLPPTSWAENGTFIELANLPDLYKVFERC